MRFVRAHHYGSVIEPDCGLVIIIRLNLSLEAKLLSSSQHLLPKKALFLT
jgi:hypothetical protein